MGVAVQQMVLAEVAGVAFTLNPQNGDRSEIAIDASWGLGEAVVAGEVTPDNYLVDKVLGEITRRVVSDKGVEYRPAPDGHGIVRADVPAERRTVACLSDEQIKEVARLARRAERHYGCPQDVEWAIEAGPAGGYRVLLLQSRPETVWSRRPATPVGAGEPSGYASIASTLSSGEPGVGAAWPAAEPVRGRRHRRGAKAGRSCTPTRRCSPRVGASTRNACSGSMTACTGRRRCRRGTRRSSSTRWRPCRSTTPGTT